MSEDEAREIAREALEILASLTKVYPDRHARVLEAAALLERLAPKMAAMVRFIGVADHADHCATRGFLRGRPTEDGGYECYYRVSNGARWFRAAPVDETPKCDCGLEEAYRALSPEETTKP